MFDEIYIRIAEERATFTYTIQRSGRVIETAEVETEEAVAPEYYGGSEAMD
jgi:hypothetical protein